ncbi:MAG: hypothetical protein WA194_01135 [Patescibacteria group bacterium]
MLQNVFLSRKASNAFAELILLAMAALFLVNFPAVLLLPLGIALVAIPVLTILCVPPSKSGMGFKTVVFGVAAMTEVWAYFLFQIVHKAQFGHTFVFFSS